MTRKAPGRGYCFVGGNAVDGEKDGVARLKASGRFEQIMGGLVKADTYNDWQP
jgi:hypothetical protein